MEDVHPTLHALSKAHRCRASLDPSSVDPVEGLLEVQEQDDSWQLGLLEVGNLLQMAEHIVSDPPLRQEACLCGVDDAVEGWTHPGGNAASCYLVVRVEQSDWPVTGC
jgi:hypothetical protein